MSYKPINTVARLALGLTIAATIANCTSYRMIRYRYPDARNQGMFPAREVKKADQPFLFARAAALRTDLDTVSVRAPDARRIPFSQYMSDYKVLAFVVIRNDTIIYETYRGGLSAATTHISFSVSKSILSTLVGIAVGEGKIHSLDDRITDYLTELRDVRALDGVTVRHLLEMKSGLRFTSTGNGLLSDFRSDDARIYYATDLAKFVRDVERIMPPGSQWIYKDTDAELLGMVLSRATGQTVSAYTEEKLWKRIGAEHDATWSLDHNGGQEKVSSGFNATALDLAKVGRLFLEGGVWKGQQIVPRDWATQSVSIDTMRTDPEITTWWQMQHTLYWWHPLQSPQGDFYADGSHGQRIYVDPATRTIIVQLANESRQDFPFRRITAYLNGTRWEYPRYIHALLRNAATTLGADSVRPLFNRLAEEQARAPESLVLMQSAMTTVGSLLADSAHTRAAGIEVLKITTERYPKSLPTYLRLSEAYQQIGDRERALAALGHARELAPRDTSVMRRMRDMGVP